MQALLIVHHTTKAVTYPQDRRESVLAKFDAYIDGFWTRGELSHGLDAMGIRGEWSGGKWDGYDYDQQVWMTWEINQ